MRDRVSRSVRRSLHSAAHERAIKPLRFAPNDPVKPVTGAADRRRVQMSARSGHTIAHYAASGRLPRLTLSPSPGRSVQNESDDNIVKPPTVRNVRCSAFVTATCSICGALPRYHAAMSEPQASPKLNDICWQVLAMDVAMLDSAGSMSA
jgi:hypothetical protein